MAVTPFTKSDVLAWMCRNAHEFVDDCDEVNATQLAEEAADAFDQAGSPGPLDDESHWIWDAAAELCDGVSDIHGKWSPVARRRMLQRIITREQAKAEERST